MNWYYEAGDIWMIAEAAKTPSEAIAFGRNEYPDGQPFRIASGHPYGPWPKMFDSWDQLAEHIDQSHEDNSYEEGFTAEANLGRAELEPLCDQINAAWAAFCAEHKPESNLLNLGPAISVPGTADWQAKMDAASKAAAPGMEKPSSASECTKEPDHDQ